MTLIHKLALSFIVLFAAISAKAETPNTATQEATQLYQELSAQKPNQPFMQLMSEFVQATQEMGRCTGSWDCKWPTTNCVNNRCVKPNGDGGDCTGSWDCKWPTTSCEHGICVKAGGGGGECTGSWDCKWPYTSCKNGFCERP